MLPIENVSEFLADVNESKKLNISRGEKSDLLFRGQKSQYKLEPGIVRFKGKAISELEVLALTEFKRVSPPFIETEPKDDFDWIVLAQHFGLPTRLLDWTYNPLSALWFAVNKFKNRKSIDEGDYAAVWTLMPSIADYRKQQDFEGTVFELSENMIYRPRNLTSRVANQSSVFTIHSFSNIVDLENDPIFKEKVNPTFIKRGCEGSILEELDIMNINESTIFPDLGGLCSHLKWRYFER